MRLLLFLALLAFHLPAQAGEILDAHKLCGVATPLVETIRKTAPYLPFDIKIISGVRTLKRQRQLFSMGVSWTMNSRHLYGLAVDIAPVINGRVSWEWPYFRTIAAVMKKKAGDHPIEWGGDWKDTPDGPHYQLSREDYPDESTIHYTVARC